MRQELIQLDAARKAIEKAASVDEAKGIRDRAEALRIYARQSGQSLEMQNRCAEIKLRAERRAGQILCRMEKNSGSRGKGVRFRDESAPTLADLGISQPQSHRWQRMAMIPEAEFESFLARQKGEGKELTSVSVLRLAHELLQFRPGRENGKGERVWPSLPAWGGKVFSTVVVDPPWDQLGCGKEEVADLPISRICASDAHLYLWVTNKHLPDGFELVKQWGFRYVTCLTWCKTNLEGGMYYRCASEQILFCVRGNLELARHDVGTWFQWPWGRIHNEKPDRFYELVMSCSPGPYAVLFSKKQRERWCCVELEVKNIA